VSVEILLFNLILSSHAMRSFVDSRLPSTVVAEVQMKLLSINTLATVLSVITSRTL
jgi:hypothetical protein